jgi:hypothetical protein
MRRISLDQYVQMLEQLDAMADRALVIPEGP